MNIAEMSNGPSTAATEVVDVQPQVAVEAMQPAEFVEPVLAPRVGRWARWSAAATAVVSLSGCFGGGHSKPVEQIAPIDDGAAGVETAQGAAMYDLENNLFGNTPDIDAAYKQAVVIGQGNAPIAAQLNKAIDAAAAKKAVADSYGSDYHDAPAEKTLALSKGVHDPALRTKTATTLYVLRAKNIVDGVVSGGPDDLKQSHADLAAPSNWSVAAVKTHADIAADANFAGYQVSTYSSYNDAEVRKNITNVENDCVRTTSLLAIDKKIASDAITDAGYDDPEAVAEARKELSGITDPATKAEADNALDKLASGNYDSAQDIHYKIDDEERKLEEDIDETCAADYQKDLKAAQDFSDEMDTVINDRATDVEADLNEQFAQNAGLHPSKVESLPTLKHPEATIDMTGVTGKQKIHNDAYEESDSNDSGDKLPETYNQFGEVFAKDGKLVFEIRNDANLSAEARHRLQEAFEINRSFLEASFAAGQLVSMHFVTGESFAPYYFTPARETYMVMPTDDRMSLDELTMGMRHETIHSLVREMYRGLSGTNEQLDRLNHACSSLVEVAYSDFQTNLEIHPELLTNLRNTAKPEHKPIIDAMIKAVKADNLAGIVPNPEYERPSAADNQCTDADSGVVLLRSAKLEAGVETKSDELDYLIESPAYTAFDKEWTSFMDYLSVYRTFIDESAYVITANPDKDIYGHGEQDANECTTSILDAAITYRGKFHEGFIKLEPDEQAAVREMLGVAAEFAAEKHPSLAEYFANAAKI